MRCNFGSGNVVFMTPCSKFHLVQRQIAVKDHSFLFIDFNIGERHDSIDLK